MVAHHFQTSECNAVISRAVLQIENCDAIDASRLITLLCGADEVQTFEKYKELSYHIERMAATGRTGNTIEWSNFLTHLNEALEEAAFDQGRPNCQFFVMCKFACE